MPQKKTVGDIWLQTKNFITTFYHLCSSFKIVKWLFKFFVDGQIFDFPKLFQYGILPQPKLGWLYLEKYELIPIFSIFINIYPTLFNYLASVVNPPIFFPT